MDPAKQISVDMLFQILHKNFPYALERLDLLASMIVIPTEVEKEAAVAPRSPAHTKSTETEVDQRSDVAGISNVQTRSHISNPSKKRKCSKPIYLKTVKWKPEYTPQENTPLPPKKVTSLQELFLAVRALKLPPSNTSSKTSPAVQSGNLSHDDVPICTADDSTQSKTLIGQAETSQGLNKSESDSQANGADAIRSMGFSLAELFDYFKSFDIREFRMLTAKLKGTPEERVQGVIDHIKVIDDILNYEFPTKNDAE